MFGDDFLSVLYKLFPCQQETKETITDITVRDLMFSPSMAEMTSSFTTHISGKVWWGRVFDEFGKSSMHDSQIS